jgi:hypothetical protein
MVKDWVVTFLNEDTNKVGCDVFSEDGVSGAIYAFKECYRHARYKVLSCVLKDGSYVAPVKVRDLIPLIHDTKGLVVGTVDGFRVKSTNKLPFYESQEQFLEGYLKDEVDHIYPTEEGVLEITVKD